MPPTYLDWNPPTPFAGPIAANLEVALLIRHIGNPAAHAGGEVAAGAARDHHDPAGYIFAAVIANALNDRYGPGVTHGKALAVPRWRCVRADHS